MEDVAEGLHISLVYLGLWLQSSALQQKGGDGGKKGERGGSAKERKRLQLLDQLPEAGSLPREMHLLHKSVLSSLSSGNQLPCSTLESPGSEGAFLIHLSPLAPATKKLKVWGQEA